MELAGKPLAALCAELGAEADALLGELLARGAGRSARADGVLLWACRVRGGRFAVAADDLAARVLALRSGAGDWSAQYAGDGVGGALALAHGMGREHGALGREIIGQSLAACDRRDYVGAAASGQAVEPGTRCLGEWAGMLAACGALLEDGPERDLRIAAARSVAAILNCHYSPGLGLLVEVVDRNGFPFGDHRGSLVHSGAALDALAAVIREAGRGGEAKLLALAADYLRQHVESAWDAGLAEARVGEGWSAEQRPETQAAALGALAALVGWRAGGWEVEWFGRAYARFAADGGAEPVARLRGLVAGLEGLAGLADRGGLAVEWLRAESRPTEGLA